MNKFDPCCHVQITLLAMETDFFSDLRWLVY